MRLVFDCNVHGRALLKAKASSAILLISTQVFAEQIEVMMRLKFDRYVSKQIRQSFLEEVKALSTNVTVTDHVKICRDPKDDMYLELALSGKADCIITNDSDLLVINPFENIPIITPKEFLEKY